MISSKKSNAFQHFILIGLKKIKGHVFPSIFFTVLIYIFFFSSCANQGVGPSGGPRDSIPPVVINSNPKPFQTNFSGKEIDVTFNEYIVPDNLTDKLVLSPPLAKKPDISTKGKSIAVKFSEDLIPGRTYSIDFQDGIKDYTEGNKLKGLRMIFSTGAKLDTLRIGGYILDAYTLLPAKNVLATLYTFDNDSVFKHLRPDFIAHTNEDGYFLFDNLPPDHYKLYALTDEDKNLYYSQATEFIAYADTMITPSVQYIARPDTIINGKDTLISKGHNKYLPGNVTLLLFQEKVYSQFLVSSKRNPRDKCLLVFNEPVTDSLKVEPLNFKTNRPWNEIEKNDNKDTVSVFITDSTLVNTDTLLFKVKFSATDSCGNFIMKTDTLKMLSIKTELPKNRRKEIKPAKNIFFNFSTNLVSSDFDLNKSILIEAPSPIDSLNSEMVELNELINDSTQEPITFELKPINGSKRKFKLVFPLVENTKYQLSIDSSIVKTNTGIPNAGFVTKFSTQKASYYGSIILSISGIEGKGKLLLLKYSEKEDKEVIFREISVQNPQKPVVFDYLKPEKYIIKYFQDLNGNGEWDTGNLLKNLQPEPVTYFPKVINVKSNWEIKESWQINTTATHAKKIVDESKDEKKSGKK